MKTSKPEVNLIDKMGSDLSVVNAARVSFHKVSEEFTDQDAKLINYLAKHKHWTPFAHAFASFRIKAPIFVARQLVKHQVGLAWNEVSRRYVDEEPEFWFPEEWRGKPVNAKQGSSEIIIDLHSEMSNYDDYYSPESVTEFCVTAYEKMILAGVAPEQARMILPQNMMTEWIWSGSLAAFSRVCKQRLDPHAQEETRNIAELLQQQLQPAFPVSWKALMNN